MPFSSKIAIASSVSHLPAEQAKQGQRQWVQLFPLGTVDARDGREWRLTDPEGLIAATVRKAGSKELVVDFEHQTDLAKNNGQPAPAAGWIKSFEARSDGVWASVEWTDRAAAMIAAKEYRYLSPTFLAHRDTGEITIIERAALTNNPALHLRALARNETEGAMPTELARIAKALGLPNEATTEQILAAIKSLAAVEGPADEKANLAAIDQDVKAYLLSIAKEREAAHLERISFKVGDAIKAGSFPPALSNWAMNYATRDEAGFDEFVRTVGKPFGYLFERQITASNFATMRETTKSNRETLEIARQLGLDPKAIAD